MSSRPPLKRLKQSTQNFRQIDQCNVDVILIDSASQVDLDSVIDDFICLNKQRKDEFGL